MYRSSTAVHYWAGLHVSARRRLWVKRAIDVLGSLLLLVVFFPVMLVIAGLIRLSGPGPVLFAWDIVGSGGRRVRSYKFRTMVPQAETLEKCLRAQGANEMSSVYFKMRSDPRVTPLGRVLRKLTLDELPSLWSVLKGDLSLVGPRPVRIAEVEYLKDWHWERFGVRPGLTSPWVLNGKNAIRDFDDIVTSDLAYIRTWSLRGDLAILLRTLVYVISGRNH